MKRLLLLLPMLIMSLSLTGCFGSGGSSLPGSRVDATTTINGITQAWAGASVSAEAESYSCNPATDSGCKPNIDGTTDSNGYYIIYSDAIPGTWGLGIAADQNCSTGASYYGQLSSGNDVYLVCGQIDPSYPALSPNSCVTTLVEAHDEGNKVVRSSSNCPQSVTITESQGVFPTSYPLFVGIYNDAATQVASANTTASSTTTIKSATPQTIGYTVLIVRDPNSNIVLSSGLFNHTQQITFCYVNNPPRGFQQC